MCLTRPANLGFAEEREKRKIADFKMPWLVGRRCRAAPIFLSPTPSQTDGIQPAEMQHHRAPSGKSPPRHVATREEWAARQRTGVQL